MLRFLFETTDIGLRQHMLWIMTINPAGAEVGISMEDYVNTVPADTLDSCVPW